MICKTFQYTWQHCMRRTLHISSCVESRIVTSKIFHQGAAASFSNFLISFEPLSFSYYFGVKGLQNLVGIILSYHTNNIYYYVLYGFDSQTHGPRTHSWTEAGPLFTFPMRTSRNPLPQLHQGERIEPNIQCDHKV
uniref:Uncharacterized protein n=1 Tax=Cacopsylla melanoneura TaxID=428564 RepID=A0A8D9E377_9HEMI